MAEICPSIAEQVPGTGVRGLLASSSDRQHGQGEKLIKGGGADSITLMIPMIAAADSLDTN